MGDTGDLCVLLGDSLNGIDDHLRTTSARSTAVTVRIILLALTISSLILLFLLKPAVSIKIYI